MEALRLGFYVPSWGTPCGVAEYTRNLCHSLSGLGQEVQVLNMPIHDLVSEAAVANLKVVHFQYEYSLIDAGAMAETVRRLARAGVPSVVTVHSYTPGAVYANRHLQGKIPYLIATSPAIRQGLLQEGVDPSRIHVIPIGVPIVTLPEREQIRNALGLARGQPAIGYFGFIHRHKGLEPLGLAACELRQVYPNLHLFLFATVAHNDGSRRAFNEFNRFFETHGLWEGARLVPEYLPEDELVRRLHAMDVNVLPYSEIAGVQASAAVRLMLAARRPIVVTNTSYFSDLGEEVLRIPDPSPSHIVAAVRAILEDDGREQALIRNIDRCIMECNWQNIGSRHLAYYRNLIQTSA